MAAMYRSVKICAEGWWEDSHGAHGLAIIEAAPCATHPLRGSV